MQYAQKIDVSCVYAFFLAKKAVNSVLWDEGYALFSLKSNNTLGNKIEKSESSLFFFFLERIDQNLFMNRHSYHDVKKAELFVGCPPCAGSLRR